MGYGSGSDDAVERNVARAAAALDRLAPPMRALVSAWFAALDALAAAGILTPDVIPQMRPEMSQGMLLPVDTLRRV